MEINLQIDSSKACLKIGKTFFVGGGLSLLSRICIKDLKFKFFLSNSLVEFIIICKKKCAK